jgi:hypothetical protein
MPAVFLPRWKAFGAAVEYARARDQVSPGMGAALVDPIVVRAHRAEVLGVGAIVVTMLLKQFYALE